MQWIWCAHKFPFLLIVELRSHFMPSTTCMDDRRRIFYWLMTPPKCSILSYFILWSTQDCFEKNLWYFLGELVLSMYLVVKNAIWHLDAFSGQRLIHAHEQHQELWPVTLVNVANPKVHSITCTEFVEAANGIPDFESTWVIRCSWRCFCCNTIIVIFAWNREDIVLSKIITLEIINTATESIFNFAMSPGYVLRDVWRSELISTTLETFL